MSVAAKEAVHVRSEGSGAVQQLLARASTPAAFEYAYDEVRELQVRAMDERFQERLDRIKLLRHRAEEAGLTKIASAADAVNVLFPHTAYKSYPESFLSGKRWDRLTKWLGTVTPYPITDVDLHGVEDIDQWVERCGDAGHFVSCSSGTTGKSAMLVASQADLDFIAKETVNSVEWGSAIRRGDNRVVGTSGGAVAYTPRNAANGQALMGAFTDPDQARPSSTVPRLTIGALTSMVVLRKAIADGTALPEEIAEFEAESARRQKALELAREAAIDDVIAKRDQRLYLTGMWSSMHALAVGVRERGYGGKDFHPQNAMYMGGGLKRAQLPADYREFVFDTFNLRPPYIYQMYGMQELNSGMARCQAGGRYHLPSWLVALPLNKAGDALVDFSDGEVEARAAFFDLSLDGRWGGVISGDRVNIDFRPCACGAGSPSIRDDIARYADLEGDDKIGCAGTVDAYVRGLA